MGEGSSARHGAVRSGAVGWWLGAGRARRGAGAGAALLPPLDPAAPSAPSSTSASSSSPSSTASPGFCSFWRSARTETAAARRGRARARGSVRPRRAGHEGAARRRAASGHAAAD
eukprot:2908367-Prymnesium_polylepis.1